MDYIEAIICIEKRWAVNPEFTLYFQAQPKQAVAAGAWIRNAGCL